MTTNNQPNFPELKPPPKTISNLYPYLKPSEQAEAEYNLRRYVALVRRIFQRLQREKKKKIDGNPFKR